MTGTIRAELLLVRKRTSTWILLAIWGLLALVFAYVVPYSTYLNGSSPDGLADVLPPSLVGTLLAGFPFFGGVIALILGVLVFGSEYGWGTLKTLLTQRPGRVHVFGAKLAALAITLVGFVLVVFVLGGLASWAIALREGADIAWPSVSLVARGIGAGWLILAAWAALGALLAIAFRGTALAIGLGILYALVIEGLLSALASQVGALDALVELFVRANGYSLVADLGVSPEEIGDAGPGSFSGPFGSTGQALAVLGVYLAAFLALGGWLLRRRDVV
jgi:ABC-2 type transport system permease protein